MNSQMPHVDVVILNYRRHENVMRIISALREQTIQPRIAVWSNGTDREFPGADHVFWSSENLVCLPRWHVAALLGREYVTIIDDDLLPTRSNVLEQCVAACRDHEDQRIIGYSGKRIGREPRLYQDGRNATAKSNLLRRPRNNFTDIVKGRFMFLHVGLLERVPLVCPHYRGRGDDIWISLKTARGPLHHFIPAFTHDAFEELYPGDSPLCSEPTHLQRRDEMVRDMIRAGDVEWVRPSTLKSRDQVIGKSKSERDDGVGRIGSARHGKDGRAGHVEVVEAEDFEVAVDDA